MSSRDNEAVNNNKTRRKSVESLFHYVSLPTVMLERMDEQTLADLKAGKPYIIKEPLRKPTKPLSKKSVRRNSPRINSIPEKRRIKLTNKGEDTFHIIDFRGNSNRKFIIQDEEYYKSNGDMTKQNQNVTKQNQNVTKQNQNVTKQPQNVTKQNQNVLKNSKHVQQPLLVIRSRTEINKLADKKLNGTPIVPIMKQKNIKEGTQGNENEKNKHIDLLSQNTSVSQVNKNLQNKRTEVTDHSYENRSDNEKGNYVGIQVNKSVQNLRKEAANVLHNVKHSASSRKQNSAAEQVDKDVQRKQKHMINLFNKKQNSNIAKQNVVQVGKNLPNKQPEVVHLYTGKHNSSADKVVSPTRNKIESKEILGKQKLSSSVHVDTQGSSSAKRKLPEERNQYNKVQKLCKSPEAVSAENYNVSNTSGFVNNTKVPPDRKTAKVVPLAKARKSITLPKSDVTLVNEVKKSDRSVDNIEAVTLLSKLVGMPISADKMEVVLRKDNENKEISSNKTPYGPPSKRNQGISNLSKLLSDSLKPSTSDSKNTATSGATATVVSSVTAAAAASSSISVSSPPPLTKTISSPPPLTKTISSPPPLTKTTTGTLSTSDVTVTTSVSVPENRDTPATISSPEHTSCTKTPMSSTSGPTKAKTETAKTPVDEEIVIDAAEEEESLSQVASVSEDSKTIYDVMADVSVLYPAWNLHILEDTNTFCIAYIARNSAGVPAIMKCIELDEQFNAKVYVRQYHCKQFDGQYNDEDSIVSLVNKVHSLKA